MNYFDLHCDTPFELQKYGTAFDKNEHHVSLDRTEAAFGHYAQLAAYCAPSKADDEESFTRYLAVLDYFNRELARLSGRAKLCTTYSDLEAAEKEGKAAIFHMVEDSRITAGDLSRVDLIYNNGCRFMTLVWGSTSCIGGAHNTSVGLTDYGKAVAERCFELGIVPDISHSSEQTVDDLIPIAEKFGKPFIASHSNSHEIYGHSRNLRDRHYKKLLELGGIVGVSLCTPHIQSKELGKPDVDSIIRHVEHYLELGGENAVCFGCDFDGCGLPDGFGSISDIHKVFDRMAALGYSDELIAKISYGNAKEFIKRNLTK